MSIKIRYILFFVIICTIIMAVTIMENKYEKQKDVQNEVVETTIEETTIETETTTEIEEEYINVWTTTNANFKMEPNEDSKTVGSYKWNEEIIVTYINNNWAKIKDTEHYIANDFISEKPTDFVNCDVPANNTIKSYMEYKCITARSSNQYKLQQYAYTGDNGLRMVNGRYCIALGSYYTTKIGQYVDVELENGNVIHGILADCKSDRHTDSTNRINPNGSVVEFVVDTDFLDNTARVMGDISYVNDWNSKVVNIKVYDKIEEY